ncbi:MAG TPA: leucine-rich repeat domain-containing protein [Candidatus Onthovicinus excrementipullorum]|nr:leucine-rich repeat domain-containing protein [Candidatus Onthovicinus excrementipullorum]
MTKRAKKIITVVALAALMSILFCSCSTADLLSLFAVDTDAYDPATEMAADVLGKTVAQENLKSGDFTYTLYSDGTASVTAYGGSSEKVEIPPQIDGHTVVALDNKALYDNDQIKELILADTVQVVGNSAAMYCANLQKVTFGKEIKRIGVSAFESEADDSNGVGKGSLQEIIFNGTPEVIGEKAFYYADDLTEIVLPDGIKEIGPWAFAKCTGAEKIIIGDGLETMGDHAFLKCKGAKEIRIPGSCKVIEVSAFYQCISLENLTLEEGIGTLRKGAFEECTALKTVTLPDSIKTMEPYVFYNCESLTECVAGSPETLEKDLFTRDDNVRIIAPAGSSLEDYARKHKIEFQAR